MKVVIDGVEYIPVKSPQRTIEINGVKVKAPFELIADEDSPQFARYWVSVTYDNRADAEAFKAALEGK